jgi:DnaJ family protein C protein 3
MPPPLLLYGLSFLLIILPALANPSAGSALYPPGLQPLINHANALLSAGTFHDAAKAYSEAIGKHGIWGPLVCHVIPHEV